MASVGKSVCGARPTDTGNLAEGNKSHLSFGTADLQEDNHRVFLKLVNAAVGTKVLLAILVPQAGICDLAA